MNHSNKYLYFMIALAISLFFTTLGRTWANVFAALFFLASLIAAVYYVSKSRLQRIVMLVLSIVAVIPLWELAVPNRRAFETINNALWMGLTAYVGLIIFRDIIKTKRISSNEIYGVISVYLLIGVFFSMIYQVLLVFNPTALYFNPTNFKGLAPNDGDIFYYSFITLSTVGYGDVSPAAPIVRSVSVIEAIVGIMYVATMIARFVASHSNREE